MNAEIIAAGSELLGTERLDTNSLFLTGHLNSLGIEVVQKAVIGDDLPRLALAIETALNRSEIVAVTGGLGPTEDDLTREAAATALGRGLVFSDEVAEALIARFARLQRKMSEINKRQAYLIEGAVKLNNPNGTAPGQWVEHNGRLLLLLPGPPHELRPMFLDECLPRLHAIVPRLFIRTRVFRITGMPESDLDQLISPVYKSYTSMTTTVLAAGGDLQVHLRMRSHSEEEAEAVVSEAGLRIVSLLGDRIYSTDGQPIEAVIGELLRARKQTLAVAESCTGGMLASRITNVPGSGEYFLGGFITYAIEQKTSLLGVSPELIERETVVSEAVAKAMADGARKGTGASFAISVTGEAGPESATPGVEPGTVWIGLATPRETVAHLLRLPGDRQRVRGFAVQNALNLLRRAL